MTEDEDEEGSFGGGDEDDVEGVKGGYELRFVGVEKKEEDGTVKEESVEKQR